MPSRVKKNGKWRWRGRVKKNGKAKSKFFDTKVEALAWEAEQRVVVLKISTASLTLIEWSTEYLNYVQPRVAPEVYRQKRMALKRLINRLGPDRTVASLDPLEIEQHLAAEKEKRTSCAANRDKKELSAAWNWGMKKLRNLGWPQTTNNPFPEIDPFPEKRRPRYVPPEDDFWAVYRAASGQDRVMLAVFVYTAARRGEVFRLTWADIDWARNTITLSTRKRQNGDWEYDALPMAKSLRRELRWWWENRTFKDRAHVFLNEAPNQQGKGHYGQPFKERRKFLSSLCDKAEVDRPFGFHGIRHLTATILFREGEPLSVIQAILRHRSPLTTMRYLKRLGLTDLDQAVEKLDRRGKRGKVIPMKRKAPDAASSGA